MVIKYVYQFEYDWVELYKEICKLFVYIDSLAITSRMLSIRPLV